MIINKLIDFSIRRPNTIITLFGVLSLICLSQIPFLKQVSDVSKLASDDDKIIVLNKKMEGIFGSTRLALITIKNGFNPEQLSKLSQFSKSLEKYPEVTDIISVYSEKYLAGSSGNFEVEDLISSPPTGQQEITELRRKLASFTLYNFSLYHENDLDVTVQFKEGITDPEMFDIINKELAAIGTPKNWTVSGWPMINNSIKGIMDADLFILVPLIFLIITVIFFYLFRSWRGVIVPVLTIGVGIICAIGMMPILGISLNVVSNAIPTLLVAIGTSDGIHYMAKYFHYVPEYKEHRPLLAKATKVIAITILLTSLTTMGGFLSNLLSPVKSIAEFGLITAIGVFMAGAASYLLMPALLTKFPFPKILAEDKKHELIFKSLATNAFNLITRFKYPIAVIWLVFVGLSSYFIQGLVANYSLLGYFHPQHSVVKDAQLVSDTFGGLIEFNLVIDTKKENGLKSSEVLKAIDETINEFKNKYPQDIVFATSLADYIKNMSQAYNGEKEYFRVPRNDDEIAQYLEVYSWSGEVEEDLKYVVNSDYSVGRVYGRFLLQQDENGNPKERVLSYYRQIINKMKQSLENKLGKNITIFQYGELPMWFSTLHNIVDGQIKSVLMAIAVVFIMALPILKSFSLTMIGLIPIAIAIIFNFAFMNIMGINLDIATSLVSAMAIGIGIDDALHFLITFKRILQDKEDYWQALKETMQITGHAIFSTSITLTLGYSAFFFSSFKPLNYFGLLNILTIFMATLATLLAIPTAIAIIKPLKQGKKI